MMDGNTGQSFGILKISGNVTLDIRNQAAPCFEGTLQYIIALGDKACLLADLGFSGKYSLSKEDMDRFIQNPLVTETFEFRVQSEFSHGGLQRTTYRYKGRSHGKKFAFVKGTPDEEIFNGMRDSEKVLIRNLAEATRDAYGEALGQSGFGGLINSLFDLNQAVEYGWRLPRCSIDYVTHMMCEEEEALMYAEAIKS